MHQILCALFGLLCEADKAHQTIHFEDACDINLTSHNPNTAMWAQDLIINFLYHMNSINSETLTDPTTRATVSSVLEQLSPQLKSKFHHFFLK